MRKTQRTKKRECMFVGCHKTATTEVVEIDFCDEHAKQIETGINAIKDARKNKKKKTV